MFDEFDDLDNALYGYDYYRGLFIDDYNARKFPWESAYYYYKLHTDHNPVLDYPVFTREISALNENFIDPITGRVDADLAFTHVSLPIYEALQEYFSVTFLLDKQDRILTVY